MAKRRKVKVGRLILLILIIVAFALALVFGFKYLFSNKDEKDNSIREEEIVEKEEKQEEEVKEEKEEEKSLKIELVDYECYPNLDFDFDFIIAKVKFTSNMAIDYDLSRAKTSEGLSLDKVQEYIDKLKDKSYFVSSKNIDSRISSNDTTYTGNIFIPYTTDDRLVKVDFGDSNILEFNVEENYHDLKELYSDGGVKVENKEYDIFIADAIESYSLYEGNNFVDIPSSMKLYSFIVDVKSIEKGISLKEAKYVFDGIEYQALPKEYFTDNAQNNMFNGTLESGKSYSLIFRVMSQDTNKIIYDGELLIKLSNEDKWIKIPLKLN